jgi:hypothetical protein
MTRNEQGVIKYKGYLSFGAKLLYSQIHGYTDTESQSGAALIGLAKT